MKKSLRIKEDKMAALEEHLQDSSKLNQQLRQELSAVSHTCAMSIETAALFRVKLVSYLHTGEAEL